MSIFMNLKLYFDTGGAQYLKTVETFSITYPNILKEEEISNNIYISALNDHSHNLFIVDFIEYSANSEKDYF